MVHLKPWVTLTILFTALCEVLWLPLAVWLWLDGHRIAPFVLLLVVVLQLRPWYGNRLRCMAAPVAVYAVLPLLLHGLIAAFFRKQIVWKGRKVKAA